MASTVRKMATILRRAGDELGNELVVARGRLTKVIKEVGAFRTREVRLVADHSVHTESIRVRGFPDYFQE